MPKGKLLLNAASSGDFEKVRLLLDSGANIDVVDHMKKTPLIHAVINGHFRVAELILSKGAKVNYSMGMEGTALHKACKTENLDIVRLLLDYGAKINEVTLWTNHTPLNYACLSGHLELVKLLLERGADVEHKNMSQVNLLCDACNKKNAPLAKILLHHGADFSISDYCGKSALEISRESGLDDIVEIIESKISNWSLLRRAWIGSVIIGTRYTESKKHIFDDCNAGTLFPQSFEIPPESKLTRTR